MTTIKLNGKDYMLNGSNNISELLDELKLPFGGIAVAVNGEIVSRDAQESHAINDGDCIEIIRAIGGG